jgi:hypothetical protein
LIQFQVKQCTIRKIPTIAEKKTIFGLLNTSTNHYQCFFGFNYEHLADRDILNKFYELNGINKNPDQIFVVTNGIFMSAAGFLANALK